MLFPEESEVSMLSPLLSDIFCSDCEAGEASGPEANTKLVDLRFLNSELGLEGPTRVGSLTSNVDRCLYPLGGSSPET